MTEARSPDGAWIHWREHLIDDPAISGVPFNGSDGLVVGDLDRDGFEDLVSVHESDAGYDSASHEPGFIAPATGHVRIAFGSSSPHRWHNVTLAEGAEVGAPEDATLADFNGDGWLDVVVAAELGHLIYLQNPGARARTAHWPRRVLDLTRGRGSWIRVYAADLDGDGTPELLAPNKGAQRPGPRDYVQARPVSLFRLEGDPLEPDAFTERELSRYSVPQNSRPVDIDGDGDLDVIAASRGESRIVVFENTDPEALAFREWAVGVVGVHLHGFNLGIADLNEDGRLDIVGAETGGALVWIAQPEHFSDPWVPTRIGTLMPDLTVGIAIADIDGDGAPDVMAGGYSRGSRTTDGEVRADDPLGRLAWFQNPGVGQNEWIRHDISRRQRGMYDQFVARDLDGDGDVDFLTTRGNSGDWDGVLWLEQVRSATPMPAFDRARAEDSPEMPLPAPDADGASQGGTP